MALPLYLAMTPAEMSAGLPHRPGWMACHFSPEHRGLSDLPQALPPGTMLILNDELPCRDHDPNRVAESICETVACLGCDSVLLDFEREPTASSLAVANALSAALPCPVAAPQGFAEDSDCAIFLPPAPLHVPLTEYLKPWQNREIWLEAALQQQIITVTREGSACGPVTPWDRQGGGHDDALLRCRYRMELEEDAVRFILFDTPDLLEKKLEYAKALGVARAVGLYQEFKHLPTI